LGVATVLDVASQRGALLWPLLDSFKGPAAVTSIDVEVVEFLSCVARGGANDELRLQTEQANATNLLYAEGNDLIV
jgi:hypothetical protein